MRKQPAPYGWVFYSADFTLQAEGANCYGTVMYMRNSIETRAWHKLSEEERESTPLYAVGRGVTITECINDAEKRIARIPLLVDEV